MARGIVATKNETGVDESLFDYDYSVAYDSSAGSQNLYFSGYNEYSVGDTIVLLYLPEKPDEAERYDQCWHKGVENTEVIDNAREEANMPKSRVTS